MATTNSTGVPTAPSAAPTTANANNNRPWYQKGALPLGSCICGIPIYLHWSFFALLLIMCLSSLLGHATDGEYWALIILLYGPILLVTIIIHEFGHALATKALGGQVGDMVLWPLGGFVICGPTETVAGDFQVAIAGPLTHLPQMGIWVLVYWLCQGSDFSYFERFINTSDDNNSDESTPTFGGILAAQAFYLNVVLFVFNLFVPAYPLDGGRCLAAALVLCGMPVLHAAMTTAVTGMVIAVALAVWGIVDFTKGSPTGIFTVFLAAWIFMSSFKLFKLTRPASGLYGEPIDNLKSHPVFGQDCYQNRGRTEAATATQGGNINNV